MTKNNIQADYTHYFKENYDSKPRFCSYWHQIDEIIKCKPSSVLEVGIGNGFVSDYLKKRGVQVTTCDIDKDLNPDVVGSVLELPFKNNQFEVVACYEVLEHIPFENVSKAINELARVAKCKVIFSIPDSTKVGSLFIKIPKVGKKYFQLPIPFWSHKNHKLDGEHYWIIGKKINPLESFKRLIYENGLVVVNSYRVFENPAHRFFKCKKQL